MLFSEPKVLDEFENEFNGIATLNKQGEAIQLIIWIADGNVFRRNGKIEFSCKGHTIEKNKFVFGKV